MITREVRPLTAEERARLERSLPTPGGGCSGCIRWFIASAGGPLAGMLAVAALGALLRIGERPFFGALMLVGAALGLVCGIVLLHAEKRSVSEARDRARAALEQGQVEVLRCTVAEAVEVEEVEDEGPAFFLDVEDGQLLFLQGQYLYDLAAEEPAGEEAAGRPPRFPNRQIEVARLPGSGEVLDLRCTGEPLRASRRRAPLTDDEYVPEDGELIPARLQTLEEDLRRLERDRKARTG
jgi:hypothetical protein